MATIKYYESPIESRELLKKSITITLYRLVSSNSNYESGSTCSQRDALDAGVCYWSFFRVCWLDKPLTLGASLTFKLSRTNVTPIDRYSLEPHTGPYSSWPLTSILRVNEQVTEARVPGYFIEAQYESNLGNILITSYDCPFEESNTFLLLDRSHGIVARAELGIPYDTFLLYAHWPVDESTIGLHYHENIFYTLQSIPGGSWLLRKPRLRLRREHSCKKDERMSESHARLQRQLTDIESTSRSSSNESAG